MAYTDDMDGKHPRQLRPVAHPVHSQADDDYKAASKGDDEAVDYRQFMPRLKPEHLIRQRFIKVAALLIIVAGLGYGAYYIGSHYHAKSVNTTTVTTAKAPASQTAIPKETYTSSNQSLSFNYPSGWKVNETATAITTTSPVTPLQAFNHTSVSGRIIFRIRTQNTALPEFSAGPATAILPSQTITYTAPTSNQQGSTYISFLQYAGSTNAGIDGIYITGNTGYQTGQTAPETDIQAVDPIITFTFEKCSNKNCTSTTPLTIAASGWSTKSFSAPLLAMFESLVIN